MTGKACIDLTQDSPGSSTENPSDSEDENLKRAIALSLQTMPEVKPLQHQELTPQPMAGIPGLNRRQQEEERLARLKRKREASPPSKISPPPTRRPSKPSPSRATVSEPVPKPKPSTIASGHKSNGLSGTEGLSYPDGAVLKTWAFGFPRDRDLKIEELLQRSTLQAAVFSSFIWNMEWLFRKLDTSRTKFVLVMQAKDASTREQYMRETSSMANLRLCFPSMEGQVNCMHSKLMLLFHPSHLRIVVPTANLVPFDWGEQGGFMENMVFAIDLPLQEKSTTKSTTAFKDELLFFLQAQGIPQDVMDKLELFDFSNTGKYAFVHTIGGANHEPALTRTGVCGLARAINTLGLQTTDLVQLDYITSSVGSLKKDFLRFIYMASQGDDGLAEHRSRYAKGASKTKAASNRGAEPDSAWEENFRCYFPSEDTVKASKSGPQGAGTVCFQEDWWRNPSFPREIMRDCVSSRKGMLMHNKVRLLPPGLTHLVLTS